MESLSDALEQQQRWTRSRWGGGRGLGSPVLPRRLPGVTGADALGGCLGGCAVPKSQHRGQNHPWGCSGAATGWCWPFWSRDIADKMLCVKGT